MKMQRTNSKNLYNPYSYQFKNYKGNYLTPFLETKTVIIVYVHGFLGTDNTFHDFPDILENSMKLYNVRIINKIFPSFDTTGNFNDFVNMIIDWLYDNTENYPIILMGHSMGGILNADVYRKISKGDIDSKHIYKKPPKIVGVLGFDTPYFGLSSAVASGGVRKIKETLSSATSFAIDCVSSLLTDTNNNSFYDEPGYLIENDADKKENSNSDPGSSSNSNLNKNEIKNKEIDMNIDLDASTSSNENKSEDLNSNSNTNININTGININENENIEEDENENTKEKENENVNSGIKISTNTNINENMDIDVNINEDENIDKNENKNEKALIQKSNDNTSPTKMNSNTTGSSSKWKLLSDVILGTVAIATIGTTVLQTNAIEAIVLSGQQIVSEGTQYIANYCKFLEPLIEIKKQYKRVDDLINSSRRSIIAGKERFKFKNYYPITRKNNEDGTTEISTFVCLPQEIRYLKFFDPVPGPSNSPDPVYSHTKMFNSKINNENVKILTDKCLVDLYKIIRTLY